MRFVPTWHMGRPVSRLLVLATSERCLLAWPNFMAFLYCQLGGSVDKVWVIARPVHETGYPIAAL